MTAMTATVKSERYHVDLAITDGPKVTDAFGRQTPVAGLRIVYTNGTPTSIRFQTATGDALFVQPLELDDPENWPAWLAGIVAEHRPPSRLREKGEAK